MFHNRLFKVLSNVFLLLILSAGQIAATPIRNEYKSIIKTGNVSVNISATSRDIVLVFDTSASMAFETDPNGDPIRSDPGDDPRACNLNNTCQPMKAVKDAAMGFIDALDFTYDRVSIITLTSQTPAGSRYPFEVLPLTSNKADVLSAINGIKVYEPRECDGSDTEGACLNYIQGTFTGTICPIYELNPTSADPSSCTSSDIGDALALAGNALTGPGYRLDADWIVIPLMSGPANATYPEPPNYPNGFCPSYTFYWDGPFCRDKRPSERHAESDPLVPYTNPYTGETTYISYYDADDYARDKADDLASIRLDGGVTIYTIGLGYQIENTSPYSVDPGEIPVGKALLTYVAECAGENSADDCVTPVAVPQINHGQYFFAPNSLALVNIFQNIANFTIPAPVVNLTPSVLDFGEQSIHTTSPAQTVTLANDGLGDLIIGTLAITSGFVLSNDLCSSHTLLTTETCTFDVAFAPATSGAKNGTVSVPSNTTTSPDIMTLQGTGAIPTISINPLSLEFGDQLAGTTSPAQTVTITNTGHTNLVIDTLSASAFFATSNDLCSGIIIAPANTCTFDVVFKPRYKDIRTGSITITGNFSSSPDIVALSGTGLAPAVLLSQSEFFFGKQLVGSTSSAKTFTLTNVGTADLVVGALQFNNNEFLISNDVCNLRTLVPTQSCTFDIAFLPTSIGSKTGRVTIPVNDPISSIYNVDMFGRGINPCPTIITVTNNNDDGAGSLRQAIADICPGGIVTLVSSLAGQTINLTSSLVIDDDLTIDGSTLALPITISGEGRVRVFRVLNNVDATLNNLIITRGYDGWLDGAGIYNDGTLTIINSTLSANTAGDFVIGRTNGGAVYNSMTGSLEVINSTFVDNSIANMGGGIYNQGMVTITNSTFLGNYAEYIGGGIYNEGAATIINSTFSGNSAYQGSDIYNRGILNLYNTILANSTSGVDCYNSGSAVLGNNNLVETDGTGVNACGTTAPLNIDPHLGTLTGSPAYFPLNIGSPAIDAGDDAECAATDQRGVTRPQGAHCDIGSFERDQTPPTVLTIIRTNANPANAASIDFTVTFSENVTGVGTGDFSVMTSGVSDAAVSGVSGSGSNYVVTVNSGSGNGTIRLDVVDDNSIVDVASNPLGGAGVGDGDFVSGQIYTVIKSATFADVSLDYSVNSYIERLYNAGITGGCSLVPLMYCPENTVTRAQMAVFLLRGIHGSGYTPPAVGAGTGFADVPTDHPMAAWIKQLAAEGITVGCSNSNYCPDATVTRAQMAVFLLRSKYTSTYIPPSADGDFTDVPTDHPMAAWIEQLAAEGITSGCGEGTYCPDGNVTRAQMAVFLVRTFNLP